uniref:Uncharacterized protein n=1 Tax=Romanomermis culicivorax TaxID=13658 RepID=A0A915KEV0_ROMCU
EPTDEPWSEHERHNSNCPHLQDDPSTGNVPVAVTYAFSSALDMGNDLQINCVSRTNNCDWVVSSTTDGHICFFTIEKEFNKTDVIKLDPWSDGLVEHKEKNFPSKQSNKVLTVNCMSTVSRTRGTSRRHSRKQDDKIDYLLIGCDLEYKSSVKPCVLIYKLQQNIKTKMRETTTNKTDSVLNQPTISFGGGKTVKTSDIDKKLTEIINKDLEELQLITPDLGK